MSGHKPSLVFSPVKHFRNKIDPGIPPSAPPFSDLLACRRIPRLCSTPRGGLSLWETTQVVHHCLRPGGRVGLTRGQADLAAGSSHVLLQALSVTKLTLPTGVLILASEKLEPWLRWWRPNLVACKATLKQCPYMNLTCFCLIPFPIPFLFPPSVLPTDLGLTLHLRGAMTWWRGSKPLKRFSGEFTILLGYDAGEWRRVS